MIAEPAGQDGWTPEFDGQRPPFEPGNEAAVTHGATSERHVGVLAARIAAELLTDPEVPDRLCSPPRCRRGPVPRLFAGCWPAGSRSGI